MTANNMSQLNAMLMKELRKAMHVTSEKMLADMYEETGDFYTKDEPKLYMRTGALGDTPRTTAVSTVGNEVFFKAYLDKNHQYTTGKNPTMEDILNLANSGITSSSVGKLRPVVGKSGFWDRSEQKMEKTLTDTMNKFFPK